MSTCPLTKTPDSAWQYGQRREAKVQDADAKYRAKGDRMYGVWRTCRHNSEPGLRPSAVSKSLPALREWATLNLPSSGSKRPFFAEKVGSGTDWTDAKWTVTGFLYANDEIRIDRVDPELYTTHRQGKTVFSNVAYDDPAEGDWATLTVDIDN